MLAAQGKPINNRLSRRVGIAVGALVVATLWDLLCNSSEGVVLAWNNLSYNNISALLAGPTHVCACTVCVDCDLTAGSCLHDTTLGVCGSCHVCVGGGGLVLSAVSFAD